jgi:hypothetical protein
MIGFSTQIMPRIVAGYASWNSANLSGIVIGNWFVRFAVTGSVALADDDPQLARDAWRQKQCTLSRSQGGAMWRCLKETDDRRVAKRLHAILLL